MLKRLPGAALMATRMPGETNGHVGPVRRTTDDTFYDKAPFTRTGARLVNGCRQAGCLSGIVVP